MPVVFYVDPAFGRDPEMRGVSTIALGYTFFRSAKPENAKDLSRFLAGAKPDPAHGRELFAERCAACHVLDKNGIGPMLGGVAGRKAGSDYSPALRSAGVTWSTDNLDRWLADPKAFIPRRQNADPRSRCSLAPRPRRLPAKRESGTARAERGAGRRVINAGFLGEANLVVARERAGTRPVLHFARMERQLSVTRHA